MNDSKVVVKRPRQSDPRAIRFREAKAAAAKWEAAVVARDKAGARVKEANEAFDKVVASAGSPEEASYLASLWNGAGK
jgi:hypothetical protein